MRKNGIYLNSISESTILRDIKEKVSDFSLQSLGNNLKTAYDTLLTHERYKQ